MMDKIRAAVVVMLWMLCQAWGEQQKSNIYTGLPGLRFGGTALLSETVLTAVACAVMCFRDQCAAFNQRSVGGTHTCDTFSIVTNMTIDDDVTAYYNHTILRDTSNSYIYKNKLMKAYTGAKASLSRDAAKAWCSDQGAKVGKASQMFVPKSANDWTWMSEVTKDFKYGHIWIPVDDLVTEGQLNWDDGTNAMHDPIIHWYIGRHFYGNSETVDCASAHLAGGVLVTHMNSCASVFDGVICEVI